jgi:hypothetical protein
VTGLHAVPDLPDADLDALEQAVDKGSPPPSRP